MKYHSAVDCVPSLADQSVSHHSFTLRPTKTKIEYHHYLSYPRSLIGQNFLKGVLYLESCNQRTRASERDCKNVLIFSNEQDYGNWPHSWGVQHLFGFYGFQQNEKGAISMQSITDMLVSSILLLYFQLPYFQTKSTSCVGSGHSMI